MVSGELWCPLLNYETTGFFCLFFGFVSVGGDWCEIASTYCTLTWEQVDSLIPDAKLVFIICFITYGSVVMTMYYVNLELMFFEHEKLVPSGKGWTYADVVFS